MSAGEVESRSYPLHPEHRGNFRFHSVRVSTRFPFGLFVKSRTIYAPGNALVYPEIESLRTAVQSASEESNAEVAGRSRDRGSDVSGLREWETADSMRRVHWKSSLRRDRLYVRTLHDDRQAEVEVRLRTRGYQASEKFEMQIRWAASEVVCHLAGGLRVGLLTDSDHIRAACGSQQRARLLSFLALVELERGSEWLSPPANLASHEEAVRL